MPEVRFEIRKLENLVFYTPDDLKTKRKNYVVTVQIRHGGEFDSPLDERQLQVLGEFETRLKEIGSPRDHWKERVNNQY